MSYLQQAEAEEYWRDREYKKWVVHIGHRRHGTKTTYVRARTEAKAIKAAKYHLRMPTNSHATARLAHPQYDLGATEAKQTEYTIADSNARQSAFYRARQDQA